MSNEWTTVTREDGNIEYIAPQSVRDRAEQRKLYNEANKQAPEILTPERIAAESLDNLRYYRDLKLAETDWVVTKYKEINEEVPAEWRTYRQALRDITTNYTSIYDVVWPTKP